MRSARMVTTEQEVRKLKYVDLWEACEQLGEVQGPPGGRGTGGTRFLHIL